MPKRELRPGERKQKVGAIYIYLSQKKGGGWLLRIYAQGEPIFYGSVPKHAEASAMFDRLVERAPAANALFAMGRITDAKAHIIHNGFQKETEA